MGSLNVVEANASGVPWVAYNVTGLRDSIRNGETCSLVVSMDIQALAERLIKVLEDEHFNSFSENALEYSGRFQLGYGGWRIHEDG
jgi:glycosyltransferase involved in cell wall biosynthesis